LKPLTPAFTKELAPGLGVAENPPGGESFGLHRCRVLAEALVKSKEGGKKSVKAALATVERCFADAGIVLEQPYLNPDSLDVYKPLHPSICAVRGPSVPFSRAQTGANPTCFIEAAVEIGRRLSSDALWHAGRCSWLGSKVAGGMRDVGVQGMLDGTLYSGTSGIALFLAELYRVTGESCFRKTACAAIDHAVGWSESQADPRVTGLYTGWPGVAVAAARIGAVLGVDRLLHRSRLLTDRFTRHDSAEGEYDLMSGLAGGIVGLIILSDLVGSPMLLDVAEVYGRALMDKAERTVSGTSWRSPAFPETRNLTGFSHGTAGVAFALLELSAVTGSLVFRSCAEGAFDYERFWFDEKAQNWPDFRQATGKRTTRKTSEYSASWCNGAPGIALSRLRAHELTGAASSHSEAVIAAKTTRRSVESCLQAGSGNFSLCHGLAGNAEVLRFAHQYVGPELEDEGKTAECAAEFGTREHRGTLREWPCGSPGVTPGLMLGFAGIGYFYLRLADDSVPSILLPRHEDWRAPCGTASVRAGTIDGNRGNRGLQSDWH
jgi:lantibiotic modifying enzyme